MIGQAGDASEAPQNTPLTSVTFFLTPTFEPHEQHSPDTKVIVVYGFIVVHYAVVLVMPA